MKLPLALASSSSRPCDFLAIGENSLDRVCVCPSFPVAESKQALHEYMELPGGQAATAAVACARLGFRSSYLGVCGDDAAGRQVADALLREKVDSRIIMRPGANTRTAVILVDASSGQRAVLAVNGKELSLDESVIDGSLVASARIVLVDGSDPRFARRAAHAARAAGVRTLCDVDQPTPEVLALLREIDVVIAPTDFVRLATGCERSRAGVEALAAETGAAAVVATAGEDGVSAWCAGEFVTVPAHAVRAVDTTGAGDAFRGGFAAAWLSAGGEEPDLTAMLHFAAKVAALNCTRYGAQTGLPRPADLGLPPESRV
jgi:sugar/nucleoside kinase (ribokinase family)